jgi:Cu/Ag efflux protein CusF
MPRKLILICGVAAVCALTAVATAIAASSSKSHASSHRHAAVTRKGTQSGGPEGGPPGGGGFGGGPGAVHSESVVLDKAGTAYITVTSDSGTVKSVEASAGKLTIVEGTKSVTYKTLTLTIPSEAKVTLDGETSSLEKLAEGDHVTVSSSSEGTEVMATDSSFHPEGGPQGGHGGPPQGGQPPSGE